MGPRIHESTSPPRGICIDGGFESVAHGHLALARKDFLSLGDFAEPLSGKPGIIH
jgi:hypothetical protein